VTQVPHATLLVQHALPRTIIVKAASLENFLLVIFAMAIQLAHLLASLAMTPIPNAIPALLANY